MHTCNVHFWILTSCICQNNLNRTFRFYVTKHHGRHDPARKERLAIKTLCAVSVTYFFSTPLHSCQKHYLIFAYAKHTVPQAEP